MTRHWLGHQPMTPTTVAYLAAPVFLVTVFVLPAGAQEPSEDNTVKLGAYGTTPEVFPYGRPWFLTGARNGAEVVIGWQGLRAAPELPPVVSCWQASATTPADAEFTLRLQPLPHGSRPTVVVRWMRRPDRAKVREAVDQALIEAESEGTLTAAQLNAAVASALEADGSTGPIYTVSFEGMGRCRATRGLGSVSLPPEVITGALRLFLQRQQALSDIQDLATEPDFGSAVRQRLRTLASMQTLTVSQGIDSLTAILAVACPANEPVRSCAAGQRILGQLRARAAQVAVVADLYLEVARAELTSRPTVMQTKANALPLGSAVAYGPTLLSASGDGESQYPGVIMAQAKWYFLGAVDKRLPDPYYGRRASRLSLGLGLLLDEKPSYQGQTLAGLIGDVWPMLTLNYDLGTGVFALQGGVLLFRQPSPDPFSTDKSLRVAPHLGLSIDLDAFNGFKGVLAKKPF